MGEVDASLDYFDCKIGNVCNEYKILFLIIFTLLHISNANFDFFRQKNGIALKWRSW